MIRSVCDSLNTFRLLHLLSIWSVKLIPRATGAPEELGEGEGSAPEGPRPVLRHDWQEESGVWKQKGKETALMR